MLRFPRREGVWRTPGDHAARNDERRVGRTRRAWRREWDSNPRYVSVHTISSRAPSATRSSLRVETGRNTNPRAPLTHTATKVTGGESGIRTRGTLTSTPDFESGTFGRSVISPRRTMAKGSLSVKTRMRRSMRDSGSVSPLKIASPPDEPVPSWHANGRHRVGRVRRRCTDGGRSCARGPRAGPFPRRSRCRTRHA